MHLHLLPRHFGPLFALKIEVGTHAAAASGFQEPLGVLEIPLMCVCKETGTVALFVEGDMRCLGFCAAAAVSMRIISIH